MKIQMEKEMRENKCLSTCIGSVFCDRVASQTRLHRGALHVFNFSCLYLLIIIRSSPTSNRDMYYGNYYLVEIIFLFTRITCHIFRIVNIPRILPVFKLAQLQYLFEIDTMYFLRSDGASSG